MFLRGLILVTYLDDPTVAPVTASNRVSWSSQLEVRYGTAYSTDAGLKKLYWLGSAGFLR
eukprot:1161474-Pelagomonas_calceolata.AAC.3